MRKYFIAIIAGVSLIAVGACSSTNSADSSGSITTMGFSNSDEAKMVDATPTASVPSPAPAEDAMARQMRELTQEAVRQNKELARQIREADAWARSQVPGGGGNVADPPS